jgi:hypothetical protein
MKKTITLLALLIFGITRSQVVTDFESFTLPADSFYYNSAGNDWQTTNASFQYDWTTSFGGFWSGGFAYTNKNNVDSGNYRHLYNCIAGKGYNLSNYYTTCQPGGFIRVKAPSTGVFGFYVTNTTYAYKSMKNGDSFARKFGDTTGTGCLCPQGSYPDFLKLTVKGYSGGTMKSDSVEFYLADYRSGNNLLDYIVKTWQWVDCNKLGAVDSITFFMYSSDNSFGFMNTPGFFSIDNLTTGQGVGIAENFLNQNLNLYPNPASGATTIHFTSEKTFSSVINIYNSIGALVKTETIEIKSGETDHLIDISTLNAGMYFMELNGDNKKQTIKFIKE